MSDTIRSFIPCDPFFIPTTEQVNAIGILICANLEAINEVQFADAGKNFESVCCPFCQSDLMEWWGDAMSAAYSDDEGFTQLNIVTPCCCKKTSLNDLNYHFPQGFYKTKITIDSKIYNMDVETHILNKLNNITGLQWRMIVSRY